MSVSHRVMKLRKRSNEPFLKGIAYCGYGFLIYIDRQLESAVDGILIFVRDSFSSVVDRQVSLF